MREFHPLYELAAEAPSLSCPEAPTEVAFPFSNDDSIQSFRDAMERVDSPSYGQVENPVAVLIGESALLCHATEIAEPTIVLLDYEQPAVHHMTKYTKAACEARDPNQWSTRLGMNQPSPLPPKTLMRYIQEASTQIDWWMRNRQTHTLDDPDAFLRMQETLRTKAVIPWYGDITSEADMQYLGDALRKYDATVTLLNLSNTIAYSRSHAKDTDVGSFPDAAGYADVLARLPMTHDVPILTASAVGVGDADIVEASGPWQGLAHLREEGGDSIAGPVSIAPSSSYLPDAREYSDMVTEAIEIRLSQKG